MRNGQEGGVSKQMTETLSPRNISCFQYVKVMTCNLVLRYNYNKMFRLIRRKISISNIFSTNTLVCLLGQACAALSISSLDHFLSSLIAQIRQKKKKSVELEWKVKVKFGNAQGGNVKHWKDEDKIVLSLYASS